MNIETPKLAVDCIVLVPGGVVLIERKYPPLGMAIPGGFVEIGETLEHAAIREMKEELNLDVKIIGMLGVYDDPDRDPRKHVVSAVFVGTATEQPVAGDDAKDAFVWNYNDPLPIMVFDHEKILSDFNKAQLFENDLNQLLNM